ncbi:hypothetical protein A1Q1_07359 [Trichosporon asahii var. asahii CBS 2479]|uniref:Copper acquisition factor BIM1-like domain-containing protein n=1 Tax=Trichosporon asahii var. asahii (strain ATCC 90039 / CBS 2479 / JCM 2466 / KCTC 7840 / NBRC 103889/ NCYC 2677 / UAMH 7654) TaxID=1186058 RepID=J6F7R1_TRIAS|nr:hypothetical protein A1Q1_07359 [Trichosporon asahii var. asahii CBS 2479]EJT51387.1 hypothetical protein A1Q1_07359 [Trichosporon asahii var. asahii CBS 2479]
MIVLYALLATSVVANPLLLFRQSQGKAGFLEPKPRGYDSAKATEGPCGGISFAGKEHQYWGMLADFYMQVENDVSDVRLSWSKNPDMSDAHLFQKLEKATAGSICLDDPINFADVGVQRGEEVTVQLQYHDDVTKQTMYSCVDLHLTSDHAYDPPSHLDCRNSSFIRVDENTSTNTEVVKSKQKVSPVGAGFIGAAVTLVACGLVLLGLKFGGCVFFSRSSYNLHQRRRTSNPFDDDISLNNSVSKQPMGQA